MFHTTNHNFKTMSKQVSPFHPTNQYFDKTFSIVLNSTDKLSGTNDKAQFKIDLPDNFKTNNLEIELHSFLVKNPVGCSNGIINVEMTGVQNPFSYSSSNQNTHQILGTFNNLNAVQEYPPSALNSDSTALSNQVYANGTYITAVTSAGTGSGFHIFNKSYNSYQFTFGFGSNNAYTSNTGIYSGINSTTMSGSNFVGEHVTLTTPKQFVLTKYDYTTTIEYNIRNGNTWALGGSIDGTTWNLIDTQSNQSWSLSNETKSYNISSNTTPYNKYRMICSKVGNTDVVSNYKNGWGISELRLYGFELQSPNMLQSMTTNCDPSIFKRPVTLSLTSPTGVDVQNIANWTCHLIINDKN